MGQAPDAAASHAGHAGVRYLIPQDLDPASVRASRIDADVRSLAGATMGTGWSLRFAAPPAITNADIVAVLDGAFSDVIAEMSGWEPNSHLSRFNRAAPGARIVLPPHLFRVLARAIEIAEASGGAFNPALGERVDRMGFGPSSQEGPSQEGPSQEGPGQEGPGQEGPGQEGPGQEGPGQAGQAAPDRSDITAWRVLALDPDTGAATQAGGLALDLSSIGKGYAVDLCAERLSLLGVPAFLMEIGGEMRGQGVRPDGLPWNVQLDMSDLAPAPDEPAGARVGLIDMALATSGDFVRRRGDASHLIDGRTGGRLDGELSGVAVLAKTCMDADGWATALFALGLADGLALSNRLGLAALFATREVAGARIRLSNVAQAMAD